MEPRIQYAKTKDGVNIACYAIGDGQPTTLYIALPHSHLEAEWQIPSLRAAFTIAAQNGTFVRLDPRGFGLSDRDVVDFSVDAMVADIEAVVDRIGLKQLGIYGLGFASVPAIAYAARHPENITHLILAGAAASSEDFQPERLVALRSLIAVDWKLAAETGQRSLTPNLPEEMIRSFADLLRASVEGDQFLLFWDAALKWNADEHAKSLPVRTLLLHDRMDSNASIRTTRRVAGLIPNAHIAFVDGPFGGAQVVREFYWGQEPETRVEAPASSVPAGTAVILFADIADSTALTERLGDAAFRAKAREIDGALRATIRECAGQPVEGPTLGDGVLAVFTSAREAIKAALACARAGDDSGLPLHLGLHAGDVTREKDPDGRDNVYGGAVNVAARISGLSAAGEVLVSETVRSLARTSAGVAFEDRGEQALKGVGEPVRVWAVVEGE